MNPSDTDGIENKHIFPIGPNSTIFGWRERNYYCYCISLIFIPTCQKSRLGCHPGCVICLIILISDLSHCPARPVLQVSRVPVLHVTSHHSITPGLRLSRVTGPGFCDSCERHLPGQPRTQDCSMLSALTRGPHWFPTSSVSTVNHKMGFNKKYSEECVCAFNFTASLMAFIGLHLSSICHFR